MTGTILDIIICAVIIISATISFFRGLVKEVLTIAGLLGAAWLAYAFGGEVEPWCLDWLSEGKKEGAKVFFNLLPIDMAAMFTAYGLVFLVAFIILTVFSLMLADLVTKLGLGPADRALGMLFGAARGFLLAVIVYLPFSFVFKAEDLPQWVKDSATIPAVSASAEWFDSNFDLADLKNMQGKIREKEKQKTEKTDTDKAVYDDKDKVKLDGLADKALATDSVNP